VIALDYILMAENLADQFTKDLSRSMIDYASKGLWLKPI
jgi:hypothetical protein